MTGFKTKKEDLNKWHIRFIDLAKSVATWSKDPDCKVGAVLISPDKKRISYGYNGFPKGIIDNRRLYNKEDKNKCMVHAEINAILNSQTNITSWTLYCTKFPCSNCALAIIQSGIKMVVAPEIIIDSNWTQNQLLSEDQFREAGIQLIQVTGEI